MKNFIESKEGLSTIDFKKYLDQVRKEFVYEVGKYTVENNLVLRTMADNLLIAFDQASTKALLIDGVNVSLPTVDNAGIIAVKISEINDEMSAQEQALFVAGFQECIKYLEIQSNDH